MNFINLKSLKSFSYILFVLVLGVFTSCGGSGSSSSKDITAFTIPSQVGTTVITDTSATAGTIAVTVPFGTVVTGLVATFTTTGSSVAVGTTPQVSGTTANNFTSPVTYTVTAADTTTKAYIVTVTPTPAAAGDKITFTADGVSFKMAYVPGGKTFPLGTDDLGDGGSATATVSRAYWAGETEVTYELWDKVYLWATTDVGGGVRADGGVLYAFHNAGVKGDSNSGDVSQPVTTISWREAMVFSNALTEWYNAKNGTDYSCAYCTNSAYTTPIRTSTDGGICATAGCEDNPYVNADATGFRMLTSDEWELAARWRNSAINNVASYINPYFTKGDSASGAIEAYDVNIPSLATQAVAWYNAGGTDVVKGTIPRNANALGLYDMSGNVWEWNFDWYPGSGLDRVVRGGSWSNDASIMQLGYVHYNSPYYSYGVIGFRLSRTDL